MKLSYLLKYLLFHFILKSWNQLKLFLLFSLFHTSSFSKGGRSLHQKVTADGVSTGKVQHPRLCCLWDPAVWGHFLWMARNGVRPEVQWLLLASVPLPGKLNRSGRWWIGTRIVQRTGRPSLLGIYSGPVLDASYCHSRWPHLWSLWYQNSSSHNQVSIPRVIN